MDLEPIPLIIPSDEYHSRTYDDTKDYSTESNLAIYGYLVLATTWILFLITVNSIFKCWHWIIEPLRISNETLGLYLWLYKVFLSVDNLVVSLWCIYVAVWWWALLSWIGLKLFRQSKGTQT